MPREKMKRERGRGVERQEERLEAMFEVDLGPQPGREEILEI